MNLRNTLLTLTALAILTAPLLANAKNKAFDVCVDPTPAPDGDFALVDNDDSGDLSAGDVFTAVGGIWPKGSIIEGGVAACSELGQADRIGTFYVNGHVVAGFPSARDDDLALVVWHFTIDGKELGDPPKGTLDTMGPVEFADPGESFPQTVIGGTGKYKSTKGVAKTKVLGGGGFQFRLKVSNSNNDDDDDNGSNDDDDDDDDNGSNDD